MRTDCNISRRVKSLQRGPGPEQPLLFASDVDVDRLQFKLYASPIHRLIFFRHAGRCRSWTEGLKRFRQVRQGLEASKERLRLLLAGAALAASHHLHRLMRYDG